MFSFFSGCGNLSALEFIKPLLNIFKYHCLHLHPYFFPSPHPLSSPDHFSPIISSMSYFHFTPSTFPSLFASFNTPVKCTFLPPFCFLSISGPSSQWGEAFFTHMSLGSSKVFLYRWLSQCQKSKQSLGGCAIDTVFSLGFYIALFPSCLNNIQKKNVPVLLT